MLVRVITASLFVATLAHAQHGPTSLRTAKPGDRVTTSFPDAANIPILPITLTPAKDSPQFIISDKPEYFRTGDGIALQETVKPGLVRLYLYHCPEGNDKKKVIPAVIENLSNRPLKLEMLRKGAPAPDGDYHRLAKAALVEYFAPVSPKLDVVTIPPRGRIYVDEKLASAEVTADILVHGLYEFRIDQPAKITVFQKDRAAPLSIVDTLPKLPPTLPGKDPSGAGRGLFQTSNYNATAAYDTAEGPKQILVADGKRAPWIQGHDAIDNTPSENQGNYGVIYRFKLNVKSTNNKKLAILLATDRTGQWCDKAGAVVQLNGKTVSLPATEPRFSKLPEACLIGTLTPTQDPTEITFTYTPPGASCLPTPILLVPVE